MNSMMNNMTKGMVIGGALTATAIAVALSDKRTKNNIYKQGKRAARRAQNMMEDMW